MNYCNEYEELWPNLVLSKLQCLVKILMTKGRDLILCKLNKAMKENIKYKRAWSFSKENGLVQKGVALFKGTWPCSKERGFVQMGVALFKRAWPKKIILFYYKFSLN